MFLLNAAWGSSRNFHVEDYDPLSVSCQRTYSSIVEKIEMEKKIDELSLNVSEELER